MKTVQIVAAAQQKKAPRQIQAPPKTFFGILRSVDGSASDRNFGEKWVQSEQEQRQATAVFKASRTK